MCPGTISEMNKTVRKSLGKCGVSVESDVRTDAEPSSQCGPARAKTRMWHGGRMEGLEVWCLCTVCLLPSSVGPSGAEHGDSLHRP